MRKREGIKNLRYIIISILLIGTIFFSYISSYSMTVCAAETAYTDVMDDLKQDKDFRVNDYMPDGTSSEIAMITLAESEGKELFVYVYNPSGKEAYRATYIRISASESGKEYKSYKTVFISASGVFEKYKVEGFTVKSDIVRYYDISSISRAWVESVDSAATEGNVVSNVAFKVGRIYTAVTSNGNVTYSCHEEEVIEITDKLCGTVRYKDGVKGVWATTNYATDSHFVAFSTDHDIDRLMEADVEYGYRPYKVSGSVLALLWSEPKIEKGEIVPGNKVTLKADEKGKNFQNGKFSNKYEWKRIQTGAEFVADAGDSMISDSTLEEIGRKEWVLRFLETEFTLTAYPGLGVFTTYEGEGIATGDVSILRLKFETDGKVYNLGVVDNAQTGGIVGSVGTGVDDLIEGVKSWFEQFMEGAGTVAKVIAGVAGLIVVLIVVVLIGYFIKWIISLFQKSD